MHSCVSHPFFTLIFSARHHIRNGTAPDQLSLSLDLNSPGVLPEGIRLNKNIRESAVLTSSYFRNFDHICLGVQTSLSKWSLNPPLCLSHSLLFQYIFLALRDRNIPKPSHNSKICCTLNKSHKENVDRLCIRPIKFKPKKNYGPGSKKLFPRKQLDSVQRIFDTEHTLLLDNQWETSWSPAMHKSVLVQLVAVPNWGKGGREWTEQGRLRLAGRAESGGRSLVLAATLPELLHHRPVPRINHHLFWSSGNKIINNKWMCPSALWNSWILREEQDKPGQAGGGANSAAFAE